MWNYEKGRVLPPQSRKQPGESTGKRRKVAKAEAEEEEPSQDLAVLVRNWCRCCFW